MNTHRRFFWMGLMLGVPVVACQDQVVTPDVQPSLAKPEKPTKPLPSGNQVFLEFVRPADPTSNVTYDFISGTNVGKGQITDDGWVSADFPAAALSVHFQEEMGSPPLCIEEDAEGDCLEYRYWCTSRSCLRGKCTPFEDGNMWALEQLQLLSDARGEVQGKMEVNSADVTFNSIDYEIGNFVFRWGRTGTDDQPVLHEDGRWYWRMERTSIFVVLWPSNKHDPYHSTTCYVRGLMPDLVDYQFRAWQ